MNIGTWHWYYLVVFWIISGVVFITLITRGLFNKKQSYAMAFPGHLTGVRLLLAIWWALLWTQPLRALIAAISASIPLVVLGVTICWAVTRMH